MERKTLRIDYARVEVARATLEVLIEDRGFATGPGVSAEDSEHNHHSATVSRIRSSADGLAKWD